MYSFYPDSSPNYKRAHRHIPTLYVCVSLFVIYIQDNKGNVNINETFILRDFLRYNSYGYICKSFILQRYNLKYFPMKYACDLKRAAEVTGNTRLATHWHCWRWGMAHYLHCTILLSHTLEILNKLKKSINWINFRRIMCLTFIGT